MRAPRRAGPSAPPISSRQHRIVGMYRDAARGASPDVLLLDGAHLVAEALAAGLTIEHAAVATTAADAREIAMLLDRLAQARVDVVPVTTTVMDVLSPVKSPSAIVALALRPPSSLELVYARGASLVAIAVDIQDPGNLGAIVRVAEAAGASGVVAAGASANPFGWKALRGSMGSALRLPIATTDAAEIAVADARRHECRIMAAVPHGGRSLFEVDYRGPVAVLIGGEGPGLPTRAIEAADERVTIPMQAPVESLNTAVAAALVLYEARRQRSQGNGG